MSTAGKVLSVLVVLVSVVWIVLTSTVAELNRNGTKSVDDLKTRYEKITEDLKTAEHGLQALNDKIYHEQLQMQNDLAVLRAHQSELEKSRSQVMELLTRVNLQLEGVEKTVKSAMANRDMRDAEKVAEIKAKADAEAEVEKLKGENAGSLARLTELRDHFKTTLDANKAMVERLDSKTSTSTAPVARSVSRVP